MFIPNIIERLVLLTVVMVVSVSAVDLPVRTPIVSEQSADTFRVLATNETSSIEKELNEAAAHGYVFEAMMAGETLGGDEVVVVMSRPESPETRRVRYKVLATNRTSTMQRELEALGAFGYRYMGQSVAKTAFGGREAIVILEHDIDDRNGQYSYRLLATKRTSTMQKELNELAGQGFEVKGVTVAKTAFGGEEVLTILSRRYAAARPLPAS
ncbi:MAG: hypothetical protein O2968_14710 [Acidobacteria bacterium]|nr:hypothetical protein [Acidobacteriota bacterium]